MFQNKKEQWDFPSWCLETGLLHLPALIAYNFMFLRFINVLQMEENIATNTELCSTLLNLDQPCTDSLKSTSTRHQWPNASQTLQRRNHTVGDFGSQGKFLFNFYKSWVLTNSPILPVLFPFTPDHPKLVWKASFRSPKHTPFSQLCPTLITCANLTEVWGRSSCAKDFAAL